MFDFYWRHKHEVVVKYVYWIIIIIIFKTALGLYKDELHQVLIKIYESGLMNKSHSTISFPNFRTVIENLRREALFVRNHSIEQIQRILEDNHYLRPFYNGSQVLQFHEKNFNKVIQDDLSELNFFYLYYFFVTTLLRSSQAGSCLSNQNK